MRVRAFLFALPAVFVLAVQPGAQSAPIVTVDVVVTGGATPSSLQPQDLVVRLDSRSYPVTSIRTAPASHTVPVWPPAYGRNDLATGRTLAILVDTPRLPASRLDAIAAGVTSLTTALHPADRVALIPIVTDARPVDFTTSHDRIVAAARQLPLTTPRPPANNRARDAAIDTMLDAAGRLATMLGNTPGVKTVVIVTEPFRVTSDLRESIQTLGVLAARHRIAVYVASPSEATQPGDGAHTIAALTGGVVLGPDWADALAQEARRVELRVAVDDKLTQGATVRTQVASITPGITIRAMPQTHIRTDGVAALESLTDMLRQGRVFTDLPLRLAAYPVLHTDRSSIRLLIVAETIEPDSRLQWAEFGLVAPDGRFLAQWTEDRAALTERPVVSGALAPEGTFRLRWAASELTGRRGTVDVDVDVRLTPAGAYRLSALMLGRLAQDTFVPVLQPQADDDAIEWYAEMYGDVAEGQTLTTRVDVRALPNGPIVATEPGRMLTSPDPERRAMTGRMAIDALAAGDYELRATLVVNGVDAGSVARTLHKLPKGQ